MEYELYHHGVLGMKWGVRRYQNKDGSLTSAGRKRYNSMSPKKLHKELKRNIQNERAKQYGGSNRWMHNLEIGENSKAIRRDRDELRKKYASSKEYKDWARKYEDLYDKSIRGEISVEEYDKASSQLFKERPRKKFNDVTFSVTYGPYGKKYADNFINRGGKDLSIARLKDLGYSQKDAEDFVNRMAKKGYTLGDV